MNYTAYISGSAFTDNKHPEKTGAFGYDITNGEIMRRKSGACDNTTPYRMEIQAIISVLQDIPEGSNVTIYGSGNVCKYITTGMVKNWRANNWIGENGHTIANQDLWKQLVPLCKSRHIRPRFELVDRGGSERARVVDRLIDKTMRERSLVLLTAKNK